MKRAGRLGAILAAFGLSPGSGWPVAGAAEPVAVKAPPDAEPIVLGQSYRVSSRILGDTRRLNVYLPEHFGQPGRTFPVLYLLDGGAREDFVHIAWLAQITAAYGAGQEVVVVGIEGVDRRHDLTSPSPRPVDRQRAPTAGGAAAYREFLVREVRPWVEARFHPGGRSALAGESLAGLFVLETLATRPDSFDDYIAVSPSLWWNDCAVCTDLRASSIAPALQGRRAWVAFDIPAPPESEAARERRWQAEVEAALAPLRAKGLSVHAVHEDEGHASIYHPAMLHAFRALYAVPR